MWQFGYVTTDLDRAVAFMSDRFGLDHCLKLPAGGATFLSATSPRVGRQVRDGRARGMIVELIEPVAGKIDFYSRVLPRGGSFAVRFHHIATFTAPGDDEWDRLGGLLAASA